MHEINSSEQYASVLIIYASNSHSLPFNFHFISPLTHVVLEIDDDVGFLYRTKFKFTQEARWGKKTYLTGK